MDKIDRRQLGRQFLGLSKGVALGLFGAGPVVSTFLESSILPVKTKEGNFHLRLYTHGVPGLTPRPVKTSDFPPQTNAIFIEGFPFENELFGAKKEAPTKTDQEEASDGKTFASEAVSYALKKEIPLYFGDPIGVRITDEESKLWLVAMMAGEPGVIFGTQRLAQKIFSRKDFINIAAWSAVAAWPGSYLISYFNTSLLTQPWMEPVRKTVNQAEELRRWHDFGKTFRNVEMSYKLLKIADRVRGQEGKTPEIAVIVGAGHQEIEKWLGQGEKRCLEVMRDYPKFILETIFGLSIQECAQRIASTLEVQLTGVRNGKFDAILNLSQDPELYRAISGGKLLEEGGVREPQVTLRRGKESYF